MEIAISSTSAAEFNCDALIVFMMESSATPTIDDALDGMIANVISAGDLSGKVGETLVLYPREALNAKRVIVVGLGDADNYDAEAIRRASAHGLLKAQSLKARDVAIDMNSLVYSEIETATIAQAVAEGGMLALYRYRGQKSSDEASEETPSKLSILVTDDKRADIEQGIKTGQAFANGAMLTRELVNLPPNIATPTYLAAQAEAMAKETGLSCKVLGKQQMKALKMGALLGVAQGSSTPPQFIVLEHNVSLRDSHDTIVLVGKGVTFDTGGYSLKSRDGMIGMKADMGGGAAVIGAMRTIAMLDVPLHVVGLIPASDNMISDTAYRPQEVLTASNGTTIEIISTDAEGRLLLADALVYAQRYDPVAVVDIATLTGSIVTALGRAAAGVFSNDDNLVEKLSAAGDATFERVWQMPIYDEYKKPLESDTADTKNSAETRGGGAGVAAAFLSNFVAYPWAHLDIAGMIRNDGTVAYAPTNSSRGYGARLLAEFVRQWGL